MTAMNFSILFSQQLVSPLASAHFFLDYYQDWKTANRTWRRESASRTRAETFLKFLARSSSTEVR